MGNGRVNRRQKNCKTFIFRVASGIRCKGRGALLMHIGGNRRLSMVPLINSFGFCNNVCQSMRLLLASGLYVSPLSCTSSKICLVRRRIASGRTAVYTHMGLSGKAKRLQGMILQLRIGSKGGAICRARGRMDVVPRASMRMRGVRFVLGGPHL